MQQGSEPSLEDILASIKQVIERDREQAAGRPNAQELASMSKAEPALEEEAADILDLGEAGVLIHEDGAGWEQGDVPASDLPARADPLAGSDAAASVRRSLAALEALARPGGGPQHLSPDQLPVEEMTRAMLRPMLAEWLDAHLPPIVERLVQAEIARILKRPN